MITRYDVTIHKVKFKYQPSVYSVYFYVKVCFTWLLLQVRIGVIRFESSSTFIMKLNDSFIRDDVKAHIRAIDYTGGDTNTAGALQMYRAEMKLESSGARFDETLKIGILVTDGGSDVPMDTA